ncbi:MAG: helix-turn-helix domain-containing protein [Candidatus Omnitrophica bacterium]|nr:helix-turn-helix domain-containing protein [Candidatus Omnitrophota bacterium]
MAMEKRYLGIEELAGYLGLAKGTVYIWVCQRRIPYLKIGRLVKFDLQEIEPWLKKKRVETIQ